jgi:hypothetical protein
MKVFNLYGRDKIGVWPRAGDRADLVRRDSAVDYREGES